MQRWRGALVTLILVALAAALGAAGGVAYTSRNHAPSSLHQFVHEDLNLTADQERRIEVLERSFAVRRQQRERELRQANLELARAIRSSHEYSPAVQAAINHFHRVMGDLQKETVIHILQMRTVLTPEQAAAFDRRVSEALTRADQ